jgi:SulP family sulfate permease
MHNGDGPFKFLEQAINDFHFDDEMITVFSSAFEKIRFEKNDVIYRSGSESRALYVVDSGELGLILEDVHGTKLVETLLPGTMVGELEMFANKQRVCTLITLAESYVWTLSKQKYQKLANDHPALTLKFVTEIAIPFDSVRYYNTVHHWAQLR